jgi:MYXO-CTERM domain-containing protein
MLIPTGIPDSVIDIVVKSYDDLGIEGISSTVTVTKGAACTVATSCLAGQKCEQGKCFWDPPAGDQGAACTYQQFCTTGLCAGPTGSQICTTTCTVGIDGTCPMGFDCTASNGGTDGVCLAAGAGGGGCCSVGPSGPVEVLAQGGFAALLLGLVLRRRRR